MTAVTAPPPRILMLDVVRGVAVMGILAMNIVGFAMPFPAYMNPIAFGYESGADLVSWVFSFIFIDGKMRGLFSFLFGASTLLVIERAAASGASPARVHYARMLWLLVFGLMHFYFIWFGDILSLYAMVGLALFFFRNKSVKQLIVWGCIFTFVQLLIFAILTAGTFYLSHVASLPNPDPRNVAEWQELQKEFGVMSSEWKATKLGLHLGPYAGLVNDRLIRQMDVPFTSVLMFGWETLAYMLFGMAALKSGFFRGEWEATRYRKWAATGFAIGIPVYALLAYVLVRDDFSVPMIMAVSMAATVPFRPVMVVAIAALVIILARSGGRLVARIAAAGRAAFTNYLGTSILMTTSFYGYGFGLYGELSRVELWLVVVAMWVLMLLWSKPWLDRFQYGPLEWLWRSLSRMSLQPMRKAEPAAA
jgi:uncharacterized protein